MSVLVVAEEAFVMQQLLSNVPLFHEDAFGYGLELFHESKLNGVSITL